MTRRVLPVTLAVLLAAAGCATPADVPPLTPASDTSAAAPSATLDAQVTAKLDAAIQRVQSEAGIPGAIVGIWGPDGEYVRAFGDADKKTRAPMKTDFFSRIGSLTKTFTVTALLQLADKGRLGLDDPISRYVEAVPGGDEITLRQLARMQSGLPNYSTAPRFAAALYADPRRAFTPEELLGFAFSQPPVFAPGTGFEYCNTNTVLIGLAVEKVSGQPLADYVREHISTPLGMGATSFPTDSTFPKPHAEGYTMQTSDGRETTATDWDPSWAWSAGAMISTLQDMSIWAPALATGELLTRSMQQERLQTVDREGRPAPQGYGIGLFTTAGWIGHNGSLPGYQTVAVFLPQRQTTMVIFINTDIPYRGQDPGTLLAGAVTAELTPDHVYRLG